MDVESDGKTYLLPHPIPVRVMMTLAGLFAVIMAPYELWRGIWPLNATTPFFAAIMCGGMGVGAAFIHGGLIAPSIELQFSRHEIRVCKKHLWGSSNSIIPVQDLVKFSVEETSNSDGPDDWYAVILTKGGARITSRPLGSQLAAERQLAEFRAAMGLA